MKKTFSDHFTDFADWISEAMGTPANILFWVVAVLVWIGLFALHIFNDNTNILPSWFTSNAFNFPLNTVTTLAELYIGFLLGAASNRTERRNRQLQDSLLDLVTSIKEIDEIEESQTQEMLNHARETSEMLKEVHKILHTKS